MDEYNFSWLRGVDFWVTPDLVSGHERLRHEGHPLFSLLQEFYSASLVRIPLQALHASSRRRIGKLE